MLQHWTDSQPDPPSRLPRWIRRAVLAAALILAAHTLRAGEYKTTAVARLTYAMDLRRDLERLGRFCGHREHWDQALRNIADGAEHISFSVCCHDKRTARTYYTVTAQWLSIREYPQASVVEGSETRR